MKSENWQKGKEIFYSALKCPPAERENFLDAACAADTDLRRDVEMLLESYQTEFLEKAAVTKLNSLLLTEHQTVKTGDQINQYKIIDKLGAGGMGEVFLAEDTRLGRRVAIKFFQSSSPFAAESEQRLVREAQSAAILNHPNICTIHEIGTDGNRSFIVMEYVEGETLEAHSRRGKIPFGEIVKIILSIADALSEAHARGIVHRDVKPSNVILNPRGQVKVLDFSLAKKTFLENSAPTESFLSESGIIAGTIAYMSPEQVRGRALDGRADIWSLGVLLYELLAGRLPFAGETKSDLIAAILTHTPAPIRNFSTVAPDGVERIIARTLEKEATARYQKIEHFAAELRLFENFTGVPESGLKTDALAANKLTSKIDDNRSGEAENFVQPTDTNIAHKTGEDKITSNSENHSEKIKSRKFSMIFLLMLAFSFGVVVWTFAPRRMFKTLSFSADTRGSLQITTLFDAKRRPGGFLSAPVFSPDSEYIAFSVAGEGKSAIYVKQIRNGEPVKLTDGNWTDLYPVWSPDGSQIVFISNRSGQNGIWAVSRSGGEPNLLKAVELPVGAELKSWNKDGTKLFFGYQSSLSALDMASGEITELASSPEFINVGMSPDEEMISYARIEGEKEQIWIKPRRGGQARQITSGENHHWSPAWFSDSQRLAYSSDQNGNYQIYVIEPNGGEPTQITFGEADAQSPAVSPDGLKIAFNTSKESANIYSFELETGKEEVQTENVGAQLLPDISPDGNYLVFEAMPDHRKTFASPLRIKPLNMNGETRTVAESGGGAKWSPDGKLLAFVRRTGNLRRIWVTGFEGQNERQLTTEDITVGGYTMIPFELLSNYFSWSPDSKRIAFCSKKSGTDNLWTISTDGAEERMQTRNEDNRLTITAPFWSPVNNRIAFISAKPPAASAEKWLRRLCFAENGQTVTVFETESQIRMLGWSATGTEIYFAEKKAAEVNIYKISIIKPENPTLLGTAAGAYLHGVRLSHDKKRIAFTARRNEIDNIYVFTIGKKETGSLTANPDPTLYYSGLTWSSDSKRLFYSKQTGGLQISMISNPK